MQQSRPTTAQFVHSHKLFQTIYVVYTIYIGLGLISFANTTIRTMSTALVPLRDDFYASLDHLEAEYNALHVLTALTSDAEYMR